MQATEARLAERPAGRRRGGRPYLAFEEPLVVPSVEAIPGALGGTFEPTTAYTRWPLFPPATSTRPRSAAPRRYAWAVDILTPACRARLCAVIVRDDERAFWAFASVIATLISTDWADREAASPSLSPLLGFFWPGFFDDCDFSFCAGDLFLVPPTAGGARRPL